MLRLTTITRVVTSCMSCLAATAAKGQLPKTLLIKLGLYYSILAWVICSTKLTIVLLIAGVGSRA